VRRLLLEQRCIALKETELSMEDERQLQRLPPAFDGFFKTLEVIAKLVPPAVQRFTEVLEKITVHVDQLEEATGLSFVEILKRAQELIDEFPHRSQQTLTAMAEEGWFYDEDMALEDLSRYSDLLTSQQRPVLHQELTEHFTRRASAICIKTVERFPNRRLPLEQAFTAHERGQYFLSIPTLLSQVDGMCQEVCGPDNTMMSKRQIPGGASAAKTYDFVLQQSAQDAILGAFLAPLAQIIPLNEKVANLPSGFDGLNRHQVLHGLSDSYGTLDNSLRAISLIGYVSAMLKPT
jgi:hypothetical protein